MLIEIAVERGGVCDEGCIGREPRAGIGELHVGAEVRAVEIEGLVERGRGEAAEAANREGPQVAGLGADSVDRADRGRGAAHPARAHDAGELSSVAQLELAHLPRRAWTGQIARGPIPEPRCIGPQCERDRGERLRREPRRNSVWPWLGNSPASGTTAFVRSISASSVRPSRRSGPSGTGRTVARCAGRVGRGHWPAFTRGSVSARTAALADPRPAARARGPRRRARAAGLRARAARTWRWSR